MKVGDLKATCVVERMLDVVETHVDACDAAKHSIDAGERALLDLRAIDGAERFRRLARCERQAGIPARLPNSFSNAAVRPATKFSARSAYRLAQRSRRWQETQQF